MATWTSEHAEKMLKKWGDPREPYEYWWSWKKLLLSEVKNLIIGGDVLDVGCGVGHMYALMDQPYTGVDFPDLVEACKKLFPEGDFRIGEIDNLGKFSVYDIVTCISTLIHLPGDLGDYLNKLREHSRKQLIFTLFLPESRERTWTTSNIYGIGVPITGHIWSREQVRNAVEKLKPDALKTRLVMDGVRASVIYSLTWNNGFEAPLVDEVPQRSLNPVPVVPVAPVLAGVA